MTKHDVDALLLGLENAASMNIPKVILEDFVKLQVSKIRKELFFDRLYSLEQEVD